MKKNSSLRNIASLTSYIDDVSPTKGDIKNWIQFMGQAPDSTVLMKYYWNFHGVFGFYIASLEEKIAIASLYKDSNMATDRKQLSSVKTSKVTEGEAKSHAYLNPKYQEAIKSLSTLTRLRDFLSYVKSGLDIKLVESYGNNQRLEMRQDNFDG